MPKFEHEFSEQDKQLVVTQDSELSFGNPAVEDYIRLTIYPTEALDDIVTLSDGRQAIFYSSMFPSNVEINISPFGTGIDTFKTYTIGGDGSAGNPNKNDFKIYKDGTENQNIYIKPNEIFNEFGLPQGKYRIKLDFLNQVKSDYQFIIKQISTSRKEVRLKLLNQNIFKNSAIINNLTNEFNNYEEEFITDDDENSLTFGEQIPNPNYKYQFKHVLNIGTGDHNPIMNYQFDKITDGVENQSLILKLYDTLSTNVTNLSMVTIEKEILITQTEDIYYFSDVPDVYFGDGLEVDDSEVWINPDGNDIEFQNYNELSASIDDITLDSLISSSDNYPNLNTDFRFFENHTFFGSAKSKLINFKTKLETIQKHYSEISSSLYMEGITITGDDVSVVQNRKNLFNKINKEIKTFTPYERFLYFDGQSDSTASAPGIGNNYADTTPLNLFTEEATQLNSHDGFNVVYKHSTENMPFNNPDVNLFSGKYFVQDKPFFNYSSSIYLSFLLKGDESISGSITNTGEFGGVGLGWSSNQASTLNGLGAPVPSKTLYRNNIQNPDITGSEYRRFVYEASMSYWIPTAEVDFEIQNIAEWGDVTSTQFEILSGSTKTGSNQIKDSTGLYPTTVVTQSGAPFFGSCMPVGDIFNIKWLNLNGEISSSFITDVKVSFNNPTNALPFDNLYHTSSAEWTSWYNGMYDSASAFDTDNIHSLENNLPTYIQESNNYGELKTFLSLQGEQYDLIKNHVDSLGTLHDRGYKKTNSPPENTYPILLNNIGWEAINPFSGSLTDTLGSYLNNITSIDDIKNNTWRKTLNNLLYIYKSKGTKNSVRGLLNVYGYPPDVLQFQEFGGTTGDIIQNSPGFIKDSEPTTGIDTNLNLITGSVQFTSKKQKLYRYSIGNNSDRILNLDWWMDSANANTIEFVYKHKKTTNTQTILKSSGSGTENLWDLRLIPSSDGASSSFEFRLNDSQIADTAITNRAFSMSLAYNDMTDGQLWNVMVQRMTGSTSGTGTIEYRLHSSLQDNQKIVTYNYITMSVSGGLEGGTNLSGKGFFANQNFQSSGSRHYLSSSNLFVGETTSGSLAEIKTWSTSLSRSKFRLHTLNKFSAVGNTIDSHKNELIYRFKLNENYSSASVSASSQTIRIADASSTTTFLDYSFEKSGLLFNTSSVYGFDYIDSVKISIKDNSLKENINNIITNPTYTAVNNLSPNKSAVKSLTNEFEEKPIVKTSDKLELYSSPSDFVNNFILDNMDTFNFENYYGNPKLYYSQSYDEFDTLRKEFYTAYNIEVDTNKFIRAHEDMLNQSIVQGIKQLVPVRTTFSDKNANFGIEIKPTILEKQKIKNEPNSIEANPSTHTGSFSINVDGSTSIHDSIKEGTAIGTPSTTGSTVVLPISTSLSLGNSYITSSEYKNPPFLQEGGYTSSIVNPYTASISVLPTTLTTGSVIESAKSGTIDYTSHANKSFVNIHDTWGQTTSDTQFLNYAAGTGSNGDYNVAHIDTRFHFISIGDEEIYSGSYSPSASTDSPNGRGSFDYSDFSNQSRFYNRTMITNDFHKNITYESLIGVSPGNQTGRMMGKTRYFFTGSDGTITLPANHVSKFSNPFKTQMYKGTQNTNPGFLNVKYEDYSTASFYRVTVTGGENQLTVKKPNSKIDSDDRIIY
tara:strand:- start:1214 stop:6169 length:4956 start_codon:yes stop_codon:yes gene_type:complete